MASYQMENLSWEVSMFFDAWDNSSTTSIDESFGNNTEEDNKKGLAREGYD